tara:strand:+ start:150 stop:404 length:255 start_codon:yes stop_codon:yes gene_type:complete
MSTNTETNKEVFDKWLQWRERTIKLPLMYTQSGNVPVRRSKPTKDVRDLCDGIGLRENLDYIFRNNEMRFATREHLAFFKLNYK